MGENPETSKTLTMSGLRVDAIEELGLPWDGENETSFLTQILNFCDRAQTLPQPVSTDPQFWEEAPWRLPCADQQWHEYTRRRAQPGAERGLMEIFARNSGDRSGYTDEVKETAWKRYYLAMQYLCSFRPFISRKGYIGLAPTSALPGDALCVILGAIVPYMLRRVSDKGFELVGEAYVYGIMDGEAMEIGLQEEEFCLF